MYAEVRETLDLFREAGGHASDVTTILLAGEAADRYELRTTLPAAFGSDVEVFDLEASRVVSTTDIELARRVAERDAGREFYVVALFGVREADPLPGRPGGCHQGRLLPD